MGNQLSFSLTESELQRQKNAEGMPLPLDPRGKADLIMLIIISTVYSFDFLAVVYMVWNRKYAPIKSKNVIIMVLIMLVSAVWFVGDLQSNGHLPLAGTHLMDCKAFGLWMRVILGACGMCSLIALRAHGLYRVFYLYKSYNGLGLYMPFIIYWVCALIVGLISQFMKPEITTQYIELLDICDYNTSFQAVLYSFLWITLLIVIFAHWRIRKIKSSFNEGREMMVTCTIMFIVLLYSTTMNYVLSKYPLNLSQRLTITYMNHFATNSLWWLIMGKPLFKCLFDRQRYLDQWIYKLRKDGFQKEYEIDAGTAILNKQKSTLRASFTGNKEGGSFYNIDGNMYNGNGTVSKDNAYSAPSQMAESVTVLNSGNSYGQAARLSASTERHHEDILMEIMMDTSDAVLHTNRSQVKSQLYTPITLPETATMAPLNMQNAHNRHLEYVDSNERQLV
ncbi:hypothetical protein GGF37_004864 [Kickxella alabastrina]|nr:hypothetical protein GGF37_004864 [Kickxella alabastrina]